MSDDTGEFFPFRGENENERGNQPNGGPQKKDDETRILPPVPSDDATVVHRPTSASEGAWAEEEEIWEGRAGVRAPQPDATRTDWTAISPEEPRGKWWMPILVGILALVLLALLSWGIYLIVQSGGDDDQESPAPVVTSTVTPSRAPTATTAPASEPTSTAPTSTAPTSSPPSSPSDITIPALRGLSLDEARTALNRKNLNYRLRYVASTDAPPGTVIGSDPAEGQQVPGDTIINLIIASEPTATATTTPPTSTTTPASDDDLDVD